MKPPSYSVAGSADRIVTTSLPLSYTVRNDIDPRRQLMLSLPLTLVQTGNAKSVHASLGAAYRLPLSDNWTLTPGGRYAVVASKDRATLSTAVNVFLDCLVSGGFLTGVNNWVWAELPRAFMISKALLESGRGNEAKADFDRLLGLRQVAENGEIYWLLLSERGRIAEREQDLAGALAWYGRAIDVVEQQRASINTEAIKIGFVGDKQALYGRAIACALALALGAAGRAYDYMERAKSRALVDLLAGKGVGKIADVALDGKGAASSALEQSAEAAQVQLPLNMAKVGAAESRAILQGHAQALKNRDPALASLVSVGALSLAEVRRFLRPDEVLIEYCVDKARLVLIGVGPSRAVSANLDAAPRRAARARSAGLARRHRRPESEHQGTGAGALHTLAGTGCRLDCRTQPGDRPARQPALPAICRLA